MFATSIKLAEKYNYLEPKFTSAYKWLAEHDVTKMEDGRYDIADGVFALVQRYTTLPFAKARFEAHNDFLDIQYLAEGQESFGVALREGAKLVESNEKGDCYFYETPKFYTQVNLQKGDFVVVPPEEIHQPRAAYQEKEMPVVKVVVKVKC
ncbi:MAG: YhcH/YjgK/YiaL family protein [Succinivibrio sp.]|nr:YhcH/YjgK/YiaL family protein [Succinivibrio sp.]